MAEWLACTGTGCEWDASPLRTFSLPTRSNREYWLVANPLSILESKITICIIKSGFLCTSTEDDSEQPTFSVPQHLQLCNMTDENDDLLADLGVDASYLARLKAVASSASAGSALTAPAVAPLPAQPVAPAVGFVHLGRSEAGAVAGVGAKRRRPDECTVASDETKSEGAHARPGLAKAAVLGSAADEELYLDYGEDSDDFSSGSDDMGALSATRSRASALDGAAAGSTQSPALHAAAALEPCEPVCQGCGMAGGCECDVAGEVRAGSRDPVAASLGHSGDAAARVAADGRDSVALPASARRGGWLQADGSKAASGGPSSRAFRSALQRAAGTAAAAAAAAAAGRSSAGGLASAAAAAAAADNRTAAEDSTASTSGSGNGSSCSDAERAVKRGRWAEAFGLRTQMGSAAHTTAPGASASSFAAAALPRGRGMAEDDDDDSADDAAGSAAAGAGAGAGAAAAAGAGGILRPKAAVGTFADAFGAQDDGFAFDDDEGDDDDNRGVVGAAAASSSRAMDDAPAVLAPQGAAAAVGRGRGAPVSSACARPVLASPAAAASALSAASLALDHSPADATASGTSAAAAAVALDDFCTPAAPAGPRIRLGAAAPAGASSAAAAFEPSPAAGADGGAAAAAAEPDAAVVEQLSAALGERNLAALSIAVAELPGGAAQALSLVEDVMAVEAAGGMATADGARRRTPGGVFFALLRDLIPKDAYKRVLAPQSAAHNAARNARRRAGGR